MDAASPYVPAIHMTRFGDVLAMMPSWYASTTVKDSASSQRNGTSSRL